MGAPICPKAVGNAHTPISHAHIRIHVMDARRLMLVYLLNFLHSGTPINRKREKTNMSPLYYAVGASGHSQMTAQSYYIFFICANKNAKYLFWCFR